MLFYYDVENAADGILVVVKREQRVVAPSLTEDLGSVERVGVLHTANRLTRADAIRIVGIGVAVKGLQLSALFPGQRMTEIGGRVPLCIVGNGLTVVASEKVVPCFVITVLLAVFVYDVTVVIILHRADNFAIYRFGDKLTKRIVGVKRSIGNWRIIYCVGLHNGSNTLLGIITVRKGRAVRENDLADKLRGSSGFHLFFGLVFCRHLTRMVHELTGDEVGTELQLVKDFSAEAIGFTMRCYRSTICGELDNRVAVRGLVVNCLRRAACGRDDLSGQFPLGVMVILHRIDDDLGSDDLAGKRTIRFGRPNQSPFLVFIIVLLLHENVN